MVDLDRIDRLILAELQKNARASFKQLAQLTGVAPSTCLERLRALRMRGIVGGFHAEVSLRGIGRQLEALIAIRFRAHARELVEPFVASMLALPETVGLFNVTGDDDYLVHVAVRDTDHLHAFVIDQLGRRPEIDHVRTLIVYRHWRKAVVEPLDQDSQTTRPMSETS